MSLLLSQLGGTPADDGLQAVLYVDVDDLVEELGLLVVEQFIGDNLPVEAVSIEQGDFEEVPDDVFATLIEDSYFPELSTGDDDAEPDADLFMAPDVEDVAAPAAPDFIQEMDEMPIAETSEPDELSFSLMVDDVELVEELPIFALDEDVDTRDYDAGGDIIEDVTTVTVEPLDHKFMLVTVGRMMR